MTTTFLTSFGRAGARCLVLGALATVSCSDDGFGDVRNPPRLIVDLVDGPAGPDPRGSAVAPLDLTIGVASTFHVVVRAVTSSGAPDTSFNRYVRVASKPGAVEPLSGADVDGRNILIKNGTSEPVEVRLTNAYGITYIVADDLGYVPADPLRDPPPSCANGKDDDGDGTIDFPTDPGCAFANDDAEEGGSFGEGASPPIFFRLPRIADVRGLQCVAGRGCSSNGRTPYSREQLQIDTGFRDDGTFTFDTVVTRISSDGFFVTDLGDPRLPVGSARPSPPLPGGFTSVFAFNFNAPPRMRVCDRLKTYGGTATEFFGFTQLGYPTWTLEEWDPSRRRCLTPEPERLVPTTIGNEAELLKLSGGLVRVETVKDTSGREVQKARITPKFGAGDVPKIPNTADGKYIPSLDASNCDFDRNGKINSFTAGEPEGDCANACKADPECTEWSNYVARGTFRITVSNSNGNVEAVQADSAAAAGFDPFAFKGKEIRYFGGILTFFSGGSQYTIELRCKDDLVVDLNEAPFVSDKPCSTDDAANPDRDCLPTAGLPPGFKCVELENPTTKACRSLQPNKLDPGRPPVKEPPPLACVFPRTFLENNPQ